MIVEAQVTINGSRAAIWAAITNIENASETISGIAAAWVKDHSVEVAKGKITEYRVTLKVTFVLKGGKGKFASVSSAR